MGDRERAEGEKQPHPVADTESAPAPRRSPDAPDKTAADLDIGWGERPREPDRLSEDDERLLRERPPHWE